ncbi:hypothetical protein BDR04DRAFT_1171012 [Suillus decipiens]|nr:hypothetical protein BDR04DRAFT_1171012 [Suillus decipiens]
MLIIISITSHPMVAKQMLYLSNIASDGIRLSLHPRAWGRSNLLVVEDLLASVKSRKWKQNEVKAEQDNEENVFSKGNMNNYTPVGLDQTGLDIWGTGYQHPEPPPSLWG